MRSCHTHVKRFVILHPHPRRWIWHLDNLAWPSTTKALLSGSLVVLISVDLYSILLLLTPLKLYLIFIV